MSSREPVTYDYGRGDRIVTVVRNPELSGPAKWIAYAQWDRYLNTDPVMTRREAKAAALEMIEGAPRAHRAPGGRT